MAWIPTVEIICPDGRRVKINETDLKYYVGRGYKLVQDEKPTSGGEVPDTDVESEDDDTENSDNDILVE